MQSLFDRGWEREEEEEEEEEERALLRRQPSSPPPPPSQSLSLRGAGVLNLVCVCVLHRPRPALLRYSNTLGLF